MLMMKFWNLNTHMRFRFFLGFFRKMFFFPRENIQIPIVYVNFSFPSNFSYFHSKYELIKNKGPVDHDLGPRFSLKID